MSDRRDSAPPPASLADPAEFVATLIHSRQTVLPRRLMAPGPDERQLAAIVGAAAAAPDHGRLTPWRFVLVPERRRPDLARVFADALLERDPSATAEQVGQAREKAFRAPLLLLAVARLDGGALMADVGDDEPDEVDAGERLVSAGCALQNMLLTAHAMGFGASLTSGKALRSQALRRLFRLADGEVALCFLSVGTVEKSRPARARPDPGLYLSELPPS